LIFYFSIKDAFCVYLINRLSKNMYNRIVFPHYNDVYDISCRSKSSLIRLQHTYY
jgi:hypothetical protein